jgi:flavin reductase (DIM6/NTAB) family NADH-FMN oxidoreductase RutF
MTRLELDPTEIGPAATYSWLTSLVVPRPIAWISTRSGAGVDNLAPHSFFTVSSEDPPVLQFTSVGRKDSLCNVEETGEFVVNITTEALMETINLTATNYPRTMDEFVELGIEKAPSHRVAPPRVAASPAAFECVVVGYHPFGTDDSACTVVFGQVVHISVREDVTRDGRARIELLRPVARLGGAEWTTIGEVSRRRRVPYADVDKG